MNVSVGKELEAFARSKVAAGDYASISEVVRDSLRLLKEKDKILAARLEALRSKATAEDEQMESSQDSSEDEDVHWIRRETRD